MPQTKPSGGTDNQFDDESLYIQCTTIGNECTRVSLPIVRKLLSFKGLWIGVRNASSMACQPNEPIFNCSG